MDPKEFLKNWRQQNREMLAVDGSPATINDEQRTVDVVWFTGADIPRIDWWTGDSYVLRFDPAGADLSLLNAGAPVLDTHDSYSGTAGQLGCVEKAWEEGGKYLGTLRFKRSTEQTGPRAEMDGLWQDIKDRICTKFSMGVEILESTEQRDSADKLVLKTATSWRPFELSICPIPADFATTTLAAEARPTDVRATSPMEQKMEKPIEKTGEEAREQAAALPAVDTEKLVADKIRDERARVAEIQTLGATHKVPAEELARFINDGAPVQAVKDRCLEILANWSAENPTFPHRAEITRDERATRREMMVNALAHRYAPGTEKLSDGARPYRGMNLVRLAEECLTVAGVKTSGMVPSELAALALESHGSATLVGDNIERLAAMGTSDFPYILANVANKTLRAAYQAEPQTWRPFCRQGSASDFKAKYINQLGDAPSLEKVSESGEFKSGYIPEARESYSLSTYGKILPLTRQAIINDDMGAFTRLPELQGRAASRKESDIIWALITANPTMGDSVSLFDVSTHGNYVTSSGTAISTDTIGVLRQKMRIQKGLGSLEYLNLVPRFLLVPTTKEQLAIMYTQMPIVPNASSSSNPWIGTLTPISEPRLDTASSTAWYLVASPDQVDTIEYAYLEGQAGAYLETKVGFEIDGIQLKCRLDFGGAVIDWRAFAKNDGA